MQQALLRAAHVVHASVPGMGRAGAVAWCGASVGACMQAAQSLAALFTELSLWARAMPAYADELCAVATGALSVLDDRCAALLDGVLQQVRPGLFLCFPRECMCLGGQAKEPACTCSLRQ